jgi:hypothetical protein
MVLLRSLGPLFIAAIALLAFAAACGGGGQSAAPTPSPTATVASPGGQPTSTPTATPSQSGEGPPPIPGANLAMPPEGADYVQLALEGGPDDGLYFAFYPDRTPVCYPGTLAALNVMFSGNAEGTGGSTLHRFTLISPEPGMAGTTAFIMEVSIARGAETRRYEMAPDSNKGEGILAAVDHPNHSVISVSGTFGDGVNIGAGIICQK